MPDVQVPVARRREIEEAHRRWLQSLPRELGQIGKTIGGLVVGPPIDLGGRIKPDPNFQPVRFLSVDPAFVDFLRSHDIPVDIIEQGRLQF